MKKLALFLIGLSAIAGVALYWHGQKNEKSQAIVGSAEKPSKPLLAHFDDPPEADWNQAPRHAGLISKEDSPSPLEGSRLENHFRSMAAFGPDAEADYQASLSELKKDSLQSIRDLSEAYQNIPEAGYAARWKVVHTLAAIEGDAALETLRSIAKQPVPPEKFPAAHGLSSAGEERAIRATAIDGLASLAKNGSAEADSALLGLAVETENLTLQRRAIRGYLAAGAADEKRAEFLKTQLEPGSHHLINLDVTPPDEVIPKLEPEFEEAYLPNSGARKAAWSLLRWLGSGVISNAWATECYHPITEGKDGEPYVDVAAIYEARYSSSGWCSKPKIEKMWKDFKLESKYWNADAGFNQPCNLDYPLGRTLNTLWFLLISDPNPAWNLDDRSGSILHWGYNYAASVSAHLRLVCDGTMQNALAFYNTPSRTMNVTWSWAMGTDIVTRGGTIIHEARHHKKPHGPSDCFRGSSCDPDWGYNGSNTYEVAWYWKFYRSAVNTTSAHKDRAKVLGQMVIDEAFVVPPPFTIY